MDSLPRWDLSNVFPSLESAEFAAAVADVEQQIDQLAQFLTATIPATVALPVAEVAALLAVSIEHLKKLSTQELTIRFYIHAFITTDSRNTFASKKKSEFDQLQARLQTLCSQWQMWVGQLAPILEQAIAAHPTLQAHAFILRETAEQAQYLMSEEEESLAAELSLSGAKAWEQLHRTVTSQLMVEIELDGKVQKLSMPAVFNLYTHQNEEVRQRVYQAEHAAWATVREPLAAALNGIKGTANTLNRRRGRSDALHAALDIARIDRATLDVMLDAMKASFPLFRRYFKAKAKLLGKEQLSWWDILAPVGKSNRRYSWEEARAIILTSFGNFAPELAASAQRAFDEGWIDAEPRAGKVGGAFNMPLFTVGESRTLANFDGSLMHVAVLAHELGHGFHVDCICQADKIFFLTPPPMTLAETASLMCETIVTQTLLEQVQEPEEELTILEEIVASAAAEIVNIYARYLFEQEVFVRRTQAELSADDFCEITTRAHQTCYGDALDPNHLAPYVWARLPHYYRADLSFYNFPYAFGRLFSTGLFATYQQRGPGFIADYKTLLASIGEANVTDLAARVGIDIRSRTFWDDSLAVIEQHVDRFCAICREATETAASTQIEMRK